ncbi:hypothetical protein [Parvibaculum sedimenti]|uniref:hypothetical protein n=1 Tax=Parvibaculum sedimenti TaxID=2608632 RepID=UPI001639EF97|nr:hypothetical protein [Parvibaculum sedimenti]
MSQSENWRLKALKYVSLARDPGEVALKRRLLMLATKCMRHAVKLVALPKPTGR